jgi:broad specificity phosphatase PhoE
MKLYIIRHLETEWNKSGILQGSRDLSILPPSNQVMLEIEHNKTWLNKQEKTFSLVLASTLQRTQQTAACYGFNQLTVEPLLNELNFGPYEGLPKNELITTHADAWFEDPSDIVLGEPISNLASRIHSFLEKYQHHQQLLIFSHGAWTRALISLLESGTLKQMNKIVLKNNQLVELTYSDPGLKIA